MITPKLYNNILMKYNYVRQDKNSSKKAKVPHQDCTLNVQDAINALHGTKDSIEKVTIKNWELSALAQKVRSDLHLHKYCSQHE